MKKQTVLIAGGTGLIGQTLKLHFQKLNYNVRILSRNKKAKFYWNPNTNEFDHSILKGVNYIINLCGVKIDKKWTKKRKQEIYASRILSTKLLVSSINSSSMKIEKYIGVSAIGFYKYSEKSQQESSKKGHHFLADICNNWEKEIIQIQKAPYTILRLGVVLSKKGGMLNKLMLPFSLNLGCSLGSGKQKMSWIHIDDVCRMIIFCIQHQKEGVFNCVSPNPVTNNEFSEKLAYTLNKKLWLPKIPSFFLKIIFGEMSKMILESSNICSKKIENCGFKFKFPKIKEALENLTS